MGNAKYLNKIRNRIYNSKEVKYYTGKLFSDTAWQNVREFVRALHNIEGVADVYVGAGEYYNYLSSKSKPFDPAYRDYKLTIETEFGNLEGYIRCCAAGTAEDEFDRYDMVISLWNQKPENTFEGKRVILTREQLKEAIMDSQKTQVSFDGSDANEMGANAQEKYNDALRSGLKNSAISMNGKSDTNNTTDNNETVIGLDDSKTNIKDAVTSAVKNAVNNGADINKLNVQGNAEDITNGVAEGKKYTKKQIEEARLCEIRKNGDFYTKKSLRESILSEMGDDSIKDLVSQANCFDVIEAYEKTLGDPQELASERDMIGAILTKYQMASPEKQNEFVQRLKGKFEEEPIDLEFNF
jgi:hypothetical protein